VRHEGRLIAMAGERMRMQGYCEVSGVCTHPDFQGRGLAGALMSIVAGRIIERGETPFLHSYAYNASAIALYESLGFRIRAEIGLTVLTRP
jgi:predicted GNAT family acetyltransferase